MEYRPADRIVADIQADAPKWRMLLRQHSLKMCTLAEDVVLPRNERQLRRATTTDNISLRNIEAQYPQPCSPTSVTEVEQSTHFPLFMVVISLIQIILYYSVDEDSMLLIFGYDPHRRHEVWRFITIMMAHSSPSHLWNNVIMQLICGIFLEIVHRWKRIAIIYLTSVVGGSLFISVFDNVYTVVASAGVYGILFAHLATITLNWSEMEKKVCGLFSMSMYIVYDAGLSLYTELAIKKDSHINHVGHIGGAFIGFLISILVLKNFKLKQWETKLQKICVGILITVCGIILTVNVAASRYYVPVEWNFQYSETYLKDFLDVVNISSKLTEQCEIDDGCKLLLDQYNYNGTISK